MADKRKLAKLREDKIKAIIDTAAEQLRAEGVKFLLGAVDRQPEDPDGGRAYCEGDADADDFICIIDMALPKREDLVQLGFWVGTILTSKNN